MSLLVLCKNCLCRFCVPYGSSVAIAVKRISIFVSSYLCQYFFLYEDIAHTYLQIYYLKVYRKVFFCVALGSSYELAKMGFHSLLTTIAIAAKRIAIFVSSYLCQFVLLYRDIIHTNPQIYYLEVYQTIFIYDAPVSSYELAKLGFHSIRTKYIGMSRLQYTG